MCRIFRSFLLLFSLLLFDANVILAQTSFNFEGINYNILNDTEVEIGSNSGYIYRNGVIMILPQFVKYQGKSYTVVKIGDNAFESMNIEQQDYIDGQSHPFNKLVIPSTVKIIGKSAFSNAKFCEVDIPEGVKRIEDQAFYNCINLRSVFLPKSVEYVGSQSFAYWPLGYESLTILNSNMFFENDSFSVGADGGYQEGSGMVPVEYVSDNPEILTMSANKINLLKNGQTLIKAIANGKVIKTIDVTFGTNVPSKLNYNIKSNSEVSISNNQNFPYSVAIIPVSVFLNGQYYMVSEIGFQAFENSRYLKQVILPEGILTVGENAFFGCSNLEKLSDMPNLKSIGGNAFFGCSKLKNFNFSRNLESIGEYAFSGCSSLETVFLKEGLKTLGNGSFNYCESLHTLYIPTTVGYKNEDISVSYENFIGVESLKSLTVQKPEGLRCIIKAPIKGFKLSTIKVTSNNPDIVSIGLSNDIVCEGYGTATITVTGTDELNNPKVATCEVVSRGYPIKLSETGYATFSAPAEYLVPSELHAYFVKVENDIALMKRTPQPQCQWFKKEEAILLKGKPGNYFITATGWEDPNYSKDPNNMLKPAYTNEVIKAEQGNKLFVFAKGKHGLGFYYQKGCPDGSQVSNLAGKAYIELPENMVVGTNGLRIVEDEASGIDQIKSENIDTGIYTLTGIKLNNTIDQLTNGIYIVNGKKLIVK